MYGYFGTIAYNVNDKVVNIKNCVYNNVRLDNFYVERNTVDKFMGDKLFDETEEYFVSIEGIIVNKKELMLKYETSDFIDCVCKMYEINGEQYFNEFRGSFSGVFYDKSINKKIIFGDHLASKKIFYYIKNEKVVFSSHLHWVTKFLKQKCIDYELNIQGAYQLLTYGFMIDDNTLIDQIKKLLPGNYIKIYENQVSIIEYNKFSNTKKHADSMKQIIEKIDILFRRAVKRAFDKDIEYGYKHLVGLSGGLDSRMTTWVANDLGYGDDIYNFTFSQSDYLDETVSKHIAKDLKHEWIFKILDNGLYLQNIDKVATISSGLVNYLGLSHTLSIINLLNTNLFGVTHTGQVGGIVKGYYVKNDPLEYKGGTSYKLWNKVDKKIFNNYENESMFKFYNRQLNGTISGDLVYQKFGESISPFLDKDLIDYCLGIPEHFKPNEIFIKWMIEKYPKSTNYKWTETNNKVTAKKIYLFGQQVVIRRIPYYIKRTLQKFVDKDSSSRETSNHMNPYEFWYINCGKFRVFVDEYYNNHINIIENFTDLKEDCAYLFCKGVAREKLFVISLLSSYKTYFNI